MCAICADAIIPEGGPKGVDIDDQDRIFVNDNEF